MANKSNLAVSPETINTFTDGLQAVEPYQVYSMLDVTHDVNHDGFYSRPKVKLGGGLFLDRAALAIDAAAPSPDDKPTQFSFYAQPGHRLGREASHNQVFFGRLLVGGLYADGMSIEAPVATKPTENRGALLGELAMLQYMDALGIPTFQPRGFLATAGEGADYLLTRFEKRVATMDTIEWRSLDNNEKWDQVDFAVATLSLLHGYMLFHGDLEFKNVAFGETGDIKIVDPELMVSAAAVAEEAMQASNEEERARATEKVKRKMSNDFTSVCRSIDQFIFQSMPIEQRPIDEVAKFKQYNKHLFRPYRELLIEHGSDYLQVLVEALDLMIRERKQRARDA